MRTLFQVHPVNLSVGIWVGFLALISILTSTGRGLDIMIPMLVVPVLYCAIEEFRLRGKRTP